MLGFDSRRSDQYRCHGLFRSFGMVENAYHTISKLARKYQVIPASSTPSEIMFSRAKLIHAGASAMEPTSPTAGGISSPKS